MIEEPASRLTVLIHNFLRGRELPWVTKTQHSQFIDSLCYWGQGDTINNRQSPTVSTSFLSKWVGKCKHRCLISFSSLLCGSHTFIFTVCSQRVTLAWACRACTDNGEPPHQFTACVWACVRRPVGRRLRSSIGPSVSAWGGKPFNGSTWPSAPPL